MADKYIRALAPIRKEDLDNKWIEDLRNAVPNIKVFDETLTPSALGASASSDESYTVTGIKANDTPLYFKVAAGKLASTSTDVAVLYWYISADNTVNIVWKDNSGSGVTPTSQLFTFAVLRTPA